jgi:hypothetical protein
MGIEVAIGVALAAASAVGGVMQASAQASAAKKSARAQREAIDIETASQQISDRESRRQAIREERVRRAQVLQASETSGVTNSSGSLGATSSLGTSLGSAVGFQSGQTKAAMGIGAANQRLVDARLSGELAGARGNAFQSIVGGFANIFAG